MKFRGYGNVVDAVPFPFSTLIIGNRPANFRRYVNCALLLSIPISREGGGLMSRPFPTPLLHHFSYISPNATDLELNARTSVHHQ